MAARGPGGITEVRCWRDQAACLEVVSADYDPFFSDAAELQTEAIAICETCPVRDACVTFAVRTGQQYGIWGGQPQQIIRRLIALERAGRPHNRRVPASHPQASKTHCKRGHRFSPDNTYYAPMASAAAAYEAERVETVPSAHSPLTDCFTRQPRIVHRVLVGAVLAPMGSGSVKRRRRARPARRQGWLASRSGWVRRPLPGSRWSALVKEGP